ncbi:MAG: tRNA-dihydrouridine synthase, partial [Pseudonocardia sp.]
MSATTCVQPDRAPRARPSLRIGTFHVDPPVVLAPMAGITNMAFRRLCREYGERSASGASSRAAQQSACHERSASGASSRAAQQSASDTAGLYVCEMITSRALVERQPRT